MINHQKNQRQYYGFDMDGTIGNIHQFFQIITQFKSSKAAYKELVSIVAERTPDIINPTILDTLKKISRDKKSGVEIHCMVYSNNSALEILHFASDIIQQIIGENLFCSYIHATHPIRKEFDTLMSSVPNDRLKTWSTFRKIFTQKCSVPEPTPAESYFYDDLEHPDLMNVLGDHYIHIEAYDKKHPDMYGLYTTTLINTNQKLNKMSLRKTRKAVKAVKAVKHKKTRHRKYTRRQ